MGVPGEGADQTFTSGQSIAKLSPNEKTLSLILALSTGCAFAQSASQSGASAPYTPTWVARHYLQWLADQQSLPVLTTQWPLPSGAVAKSLSGLSSTSAGENSTALAF